MVTRKPHFKSKTCSNGSVFLLGQIHGSLRTETFNVMIDDPTADLMSTDIIMQNCDNSITSELIIT